VSSKNLLEYVSQAKTFVAETRAELAKVTFPSKEEVKNTTIVVIVTSVIFAIFLWFADFLILRGYDGLYELLGR
jgi:preprotein translocase subunit SecE